MRERECSFFDIVGVAGVEIYFYFKWTPHNAAGFTVIGVHCTLQYSLYAVVYPASINIKISSTVYSAGLFNFSVIYSVI